MKAQDLGLNESSYKLMLSLLSKELATLSPLKVYVFGSRARGDFKKNSDLDLVVEIYNGTMSALDAEKLKGKFEDSNFPYKVDVVPSEKVFEAYRKQIESEKKLLLEL